MIKINLVAEGRKPVVARRAKEALGAAGSLAEWLFLGLIAVGLLVTGGYYWHLKGEREERAQMIVDAEREVEELRPIIKEVEEYKVKKAELERKISVINNLKENQKGPVRVMDAISKALPELLWLDSMTVRGNTVELRGRAFNANQVATFHKSLDDTPEFQEPNLRMVQQSGQVYTFDLSFNYTLPKPETNGAEAPAGDDAGSGGGE